MSSYSTKPCCLNMAFWLWQHILIYDVKKAGAQRESQSLFCINVESITITGTHNWHVRSLTKTRIIIVARRTTESNNTWYPGDSKMNSSNEIVDGWVDIWGAVKEERWKKGKGLRTYTWRAALSRGTIYWPATDVTFCFFVLLGKWL